MMRAMFAIMDADGDGAPSREEFREAHDRILNHMDADGGGDGRVTLEEMQVFMVAIPATGPADGDAGEQADGPSSEARARKPAWISWSR